MIGAAEGEGIDPATARRLFAAARRAFGFGDLPVAAALLHQSRVLAVARNQVRSSASRLAHAEMRLLARAEPIDARAELCVCTTLEPCLMCLAACAHAGVERVIYACPDPVAGAGRVRPPEGWYAARWPRLVHDPRYQAEALDLLLDYLAARPEWGGYYEAFRARFD